MAGALTRMLGFQGATLPGSSTWTLVEARNCTSSPAANQDFTTLGGYDELLIVLNGVTCSGSSARLVLVSDDNGSTFYNSSGNYGSVDGAGVSTSVAELFLSSAGTAAQYAFLYIPSLTGHQKMALSSAGTTVAQRVFKGSTARVNAIRVSSGSGNTLNGGTIYIYARTNPWTLAGSNTSPGASNIDFTGLSAYDELLLVMDGVTASASANRRVNYSVNNGSSFYVGVTDYQREYAAAGTVSDWADAQLCSGDTTAALTFHHHLLNTKGAMKAGFSLGGRESDASHDPGHSFKASSSQVDAIRLETRLAATLNGGSVYLYGRSKPWTLVEARACASSPAANQDFINLAAYEELLIVMDGVGASASAWRDVHFSVNNGSSFYSTNGDYYAAMTAAGGKTDFSTPAYTGTQTASARYMILHIPHTKGAVKPVLSTGGTPYSMFVASASQINAVRFASLVAGTLNSGTFYVYGR